MVTGHSACGETESGVWRRLLSVAAAGSCAVVCVCVVMYVCVGWTEVYETPPHLYRYHSMALQCPLLVESDEAADAVILSAFRTHLKQT